MLLKLFKTNNQQLPKKILIVFWWFILCILLHFYAQLHQLKPLLIITFALENGSRFLLAVLVYLYVKSVFEQQHNFIRKHSIHLIPFLLYFLFFILPATINHTLNKDIFLYPRTINQHVNWALIKDSYGIVYLLLALKTFYHHEPRLKQFFSDFKERNFLWIKKFVILFLTTISIDFIITISEIAFGYNVDWDAYITLCFLIATIGYLGYYGLTQNTLIIDEIHVKKTSSSQEVGARAQTQLPPEEAKQLQLQLDTLLKDDKVYLQPDLTLNELSQKMNISSRQLSTFLNEVLQTSFYETINYHRVEEAKHLLITDKVLQYKITAIGQLCGFNSKSSFYRVFKNTTGHSPSEYRQMQLKT